MSRRTEDVQTQRLRMRCDQCGKTESFVGIENVPYVLSRDAGWRMAHIATGTEMIAFDYCSRACADRALTEEVARMYLPERRRSMSRRTEGGCGLLVLSFVFALGLLGLLAVLVVLR